MTSLSLSVQWYLKICPQIRLDIRKLILLLRKVYYEFSLFGTKAKIYYKLCGLYSFFLLHLPALSHSRYSSVASKLCN